MLHLPDREAVIVAGLTVLAIERKGKASLPTSQKAHDLFGAEAMADVLQPLRILAMPEMWRGFLLIIQGKRILPVM